MTTTLVGPDSVIITTAQNNNWNNLDAAFIEANRKESTYYNLEVRGIAIVGGQAQIKSYTLFTLRLDSSEFATNVMDLLVMIQVSVVRQVRVLHQISVRVTVTIKDQIVKRTVITMINVVHVIVMDPLVLRHQYLLHHQNHLKNRLVVYLIDVV